MKTLLLASVLAFTSMTVSAIPATNSLTCEQLNSAVAENNTDLIHTISEAAGRDAAMKLFIDYGYDNAGVIIDTAADSPNSILLMGVMLINGCSETPHTPVHKVAYDAILHIYNITAQ